MSFQPYYPQYPPAFAPQTASQPFRQEQGLGYSPAPQMSQQSVAAPSVGFMTRPVTSKEEALGVQVDFFGPGTIMPDLGHGKIYLKKFNQNTGASDLFVFALEAATEQPPEPQYATRADVDGIREDLERVFDELDRMRRPAKGVKRNDDE